MVRLCRFNAILGLALVALLSACGVEVVAPPTPTVPSASSEASAQTTITSMPGATRIPAQPTLVPSATIPPTTSPLPSPTPRDTIATLVPADATASPTTESAAQPTASGDEAAITRIRQRYATINGAVAQYRKTERILDGLSTEGGNLVAFYDGATLRKLVATYFGESGRATEEYYLWDDQVFFVFRTDETYDEPFGKVVTSAESRYYFVDNRMIRWIDPDGRQVPATDAEFTPRQNEQLQQAQTLLALLSS